MEVVARFEVYLVRLDPTEGHEIRKTRPCIIVSPDEMNRHIATVIVAPTSRARVVSSGDQESPGRRRKGRAQCEYPR